jgi:hypothetical protein
MNEEFFILANKMGWNANDQVTILLRYIEQQNSDVCFIDYLNEIKELDKIDNED